MYIAVDAIANEDDAKLSYLMFPYDEDFLDAIEENLWVVNIDSHHKTQRLLKQFIYKFSS